MKKSLKVFALSSMVLLGLSQVQLNTILAQTSQGQGVSAEETKEESDEESKDESAEDESSEEGEEAADDEKKSESSEDWEAFGEKIQTAMKAKNIELLYESKEAIEFEENDLVTSLDSYAYYKVEDFGRDFKIQYDQTDEAGVLVFKVRLENNSDETVYYNNAPRVETSDANTIIYDTDALVGGSEFEEYLPLGTDQQELAPGESVEGYLTYAVKPDGMEIIDADGTVVVEYIGFRDQSDFSGATELLKNPEILLPLSEDAEETAAATGEQYPDKIVSDKIGTKNVIEQEDTDASQEVEDLVVTVSGYEISEIVPSEGSKAQFEDFPGGVVSINVKLDITNNSKDQTVDLAGVYSNLVLGDMIQYMNNNFISANDSNAEIAPGETGTTYQVFTIDGEAWEKFKEDSMMIIPSIKDKDYEDMHDYEAIQVKFKE